LIVESWGLAASIAWSITTTPSASYRHRACPGASLIADVVLARL